VIRPAGPRSRMSSTVILPGCTKCLRYRRFQVHVKLIVNVDCLIPPLTGVGRYAQGILRELLRHPEVLDLQAFASSGHFDRRALTGILECAEPSGSAEPLGSAGLLQSSGHGAVALAGPPRLRALALARPWLVGVPGVRMARRALRAWALGRRSRSLQGYVYLEPNFLLAPYAGASVVVVHDLSHLRYPQFHPVRRVEELVQKLPESLRAASRIVAVSEFTRRELNAFFPAVGDVAVVSPAVDAAFFTVSDRQRAMVAARYRLPPRYVLSVATLEPRKNLSALLEAWSSLPPAVRSSAPLVLAGHRGWLNESLSRRMEALEASGLVRYLGYVPQSDVAPLLAGATVLAYVSFYEGFGMPVAEAMAAGTAVLASSVTSIPEVAAGAACLVNPHAVDSIRAGLLALLSGDDLRLSCEKKGRERARQLTWAASAAALLDVLRPLAAGAER